MKNKWTWYSLIMVVSVLVASLVLSIMIKKSRVSDADDRGFAISDDFEEPAQLPEYGVTTSLRNNASDSPLKLPLPSAVSVGSVLHNTVSPLSEINSFDDITERLRVVNDPIERQKILDAAFDWLRSIPADMARVYLLQYLNSGQDIEIGMPFRVGPGGQLRSHPTLRVAALDWLGAIDGPSAASYTPELVSHSKSPDEWAIGLRNYGRLVQAASDPYFEDLINQMIKNPEWRVNPSGGYLEAFDAVVFNRQYSLVPTLVELSSSNNPIRFIGAKVIESLMHEDSNGMIAYVHENRALFDAVPDLRANMYGLADLGDPDQVAMLQQYLSSESISQEEKIRYLSMFPIQSKMLGYRLLTEPFAPPLARRAMLDYEALLISEKWLDLPELQHIHDAIRRERGRLLEYIESARRGGVL